jgi:hypothetical protein
MNSPVEIEVATLTLINENVIKITYKTGVNVGLSDVKEIEQICVDFSKGRKFYCLTMAMGIHSNITQDAQRYLSHDADIVPRILGSAIVLTTLPIRILARFFIQFHKPKYPTKIFSSEQEAMLWISSNED